ncbi:MAG: hypothetical protein AAGU74_10330 [Bacillota bacterium]
MAYIAAKCPACGAGIQVPDDTQKTFCTYCGSSIISEDAIKLNKVQVVGTVEVAGIATLEKLIETAEANMYIEQYDRAFQVFNQITLEYPADYRGWWGKLRSYSHEFMAYPHKSGSEFIQWSKIAMKIMEDGKRKELYIKIYENYYNRTNYDFLIALHSAVKNTKALSLEIPAYERLMEEFNELKQQADNMGA